MSQLAIVVPCYNEEDVLPEMAARLLSLLARLAARGSISDRSLVYFVDDGSTDGTWSIISSLAQQQPQVVGIKLSRNRGHQNALLAGLFTAHGDAIVSVDADLQDDITAIEDMVAHYRDGVDVVYGVRKKRDTDSAFKRVTAQLFYRLMGILGVEAVPHHADFRLLSRRALEALRDFTEINLFLRGIVPLLGFRSSLVYYDRARRFAGISKYPFKRMVGLALDAITSFSIVPLRLITFTGFAVFIIALALGGWSLYVRLFTTTAVPGWTSTVLPMYFLGGIQLLCIGVIGEYLGKVYQEVKRRPRYLIESVVNAPAPVHPAAQVAPVAK